MKKGDKEFINKLLELVITYMTESRKNEERKVQGESFAERLSYNTLIS